jgi:hypothetical protein
VRVLVCGGRNFNRPDRIRDALENLLFHGTTIPPGLVIIDGGCPTGADQLAHEWATRNGLATERYPVDHALDGPWPAAGPRRNGRMLRESKPDKGVAFPGGRGTADMVKRMKAAGIKVIELQWQGDK